MNFQGRNLVLINFSAFLILTMPLIGGLLYIAGSLVYWPSFQGLNPNDGGILFIVGSIALLLNDLAASYLQPQFSFHRPLDNAGAFKTCVQMLGNVAFVVGSVYFLDFLPIIVGCDLFLLSSVFQFIGQFLGIWGVVSLNPFTATYYTKMIIYKKAVIWIHIFLFVGCMGFVLGSWLFIDFNSQSVQLQQIAVMLYAVGSLGYVLSSLVAFQMKRKRIIDPLSQYHQQIYSYFFPKPHPPQKLIPLIGYNLPVKKQKQNIVISYQPSISIRQQMSIIAEVQNDKQIKKYKKITQIAQ